MRLAPATLVWRTMPQNLLLSLINKAVDRSPVMNESSEAHGLGKDTTEQRGRIFTNADAAVESMGAAFARASQECASQLKEANLVLGGQLVRLRTVGVKLHDRIMRPLAHLETSLRSGELNPIGLTIDLWDELETGIDFSGLAIDDELDAGKGDLVTDSFAPQYA